MCEIRLFIQVWRRFKNVCIFKQQPFSFDNESKSVDYSKVQNDGKHWVLFLIKQKRCFTLGNLFKVYCKVWNWKMVTGNTANYLCSMDKPDTVLSEPISLYILSANSAEIFPQCKAPIWDTKLFVCTSKEFENHYLWNGTLTFSHWNVYAISIRLKSLCSTSPL